MNGYLLDTNHLGLALRRTSHARRAIYEARLAGARVGTCAPVLCELEAGLVFTADPKENRLLLRGLLRELRLWPIDAIVARHYGEIFGELRATGRVLSQVDMMVGALAPYGTHGIDHRSRLLRRARCHERQLGSDRVIDFL